MIDLKGMNIVSVSRGPHKTYLSSDDKAYLMIRIKKDAITTITNSYSSEMCPQTSNGKACSAYGKLSQTLRILVCKAKNIKLLKKDYQLFHIFRKKKKQRRESGRSVEMPDDKTVLKPKTVLKNDNSQYYQQKPRHIDLDKDRLPVQHQMMWLEKLIAIALPQFHQDEFHHCKDHLGCCNDYC